MPTQENFKTVVSIAFPDGRTSSFAGVVEGIIPKEPASKYEPGYPYRSFFFVPKLNKYYFESELTPTELERFNHRYKAVQELKKGLPFLNIQLVEQEDFDWFVARMFATDRAGVSKGMVEIIL